MGGEAVENRYFHTRENRSDLVVEGYALDEFAGAGACQGRRPRSQEVHQQAIDISIFI